MLQDGEQPPGSDRPLPIPRDGIGHCSEETHEDDYSESKRQDTRVGTIGTADLLTSEVTGRWAVETAPSVNGENDSPRSLGDMAADDVAGQEKSGESIASDALLTLVNSDDQGAGSQNNVEHVVSKTKEQHRVLSAMIRILDPVFRKQISRSIHENNELSDAETEEGSEDDDTDDDSDEPLVEDSVG
jgi:hypothetical protein